jgi:hypothetical protein
MTHRWDEFSKSLAEPVPRRESLRRLGFVFAGAVLSPLGLRTAWARGVDPCKAFCNCRKTSQQNACLAACKACNGDTSRVCGACGTYICCGSGRSCCGSYCADLAGDVYNCGACGKMCPPPGPYEFVACVSGRCVRNCAAGTVRCGGVCTPLASDPNNCGACGNVCGPSAPYCVGGSCMYVDCPPGLYVCGGNCVDLLTDPYNCGACFNSCAPSEFCSGGFCEGICVGCE